MTSDPYPPLRPQRPVRAASRPVPWLMIVGVGLLALLTGVVIAILLGGDREGGVGASVEGSPSASASASASESASPSASASASASEAPSGTPAATPSPLALDTIVATNVDGLSVRREPGRSAERLGTLAIGMESFVVQGPTDADGFPWYLVSALGLPPSTGCAGPFENEPYNCPIWFGWVAGAGEDGEPWLVPDPPDCPEAPVTAESLMLAQTDLQRLACFGAEPFTFRAWWPELPDGELAGPCGAQDRPSGWLLCQSNNLNQLTTDESQGYGGIGARVSINPASGIAMPARGTWVEVRVHLDDPAAQGCADGAELVYDDPIPEQAIVNCRAQMVLESVAVVAGP